MKKKINAKYYRDWYKSLSAEKREKRLKQKRDYYHRTKDKPKEIERRKLQSKMLLQVHDELVFDMHKSESLELKNLVKEKMEKAVTLAVPLIVDIGEGANWLEAH